MLHAQDLSYTYTGGEPLQFPDIRCEKGEHHLLLGQSGSGKTTLLHLLGGLLTPSSGQVIVNGTDLGGLSGSQLDRFRGQTIGIVFQTAHFVASLSVSENLLLAQRLAGLPSDPVRVRTLLEQLSLGHKYEKSVGNLSVGEQQRVAIARALINRPAVILADEPTSALDDENSERVIQLLEEQAAAVDATLLIVTHDNRLKDHFANRIILERQSPTA